jgi:hypothetical protein
MQPDPFTILQQLAALQNLAVGPDVKEVVSRLREPLKHYAELEFRSDGKRIDLITLSNEPNAVATFLSILQERGTTENELATCKALLRFGAGKVVGMKLPIAGPTAGGELYIRGALPLSEVTYFLERLGVKAEATLRVANLARIFGKGHTHMLATNAAFPPSFTVFFTTYLVPSEEHTDQQRLQQALQEIGIADEGIAALLRLHRLLGASRPKTLYFSWGIVNGEPTIQAKIDYADVRLGVVSEATDAVGATAQADIPIQWGRQLGLRKANYAGVIVSATRLAAVRAYFTRCWPK